MGTPTCQLISQLSSSTPLTPVTIFGLIDVLIATGGDDLRGNSGLTMEIFVPGSNAAFAQTLKNSGDPSWDGAVHDFHIPIPNSVSPPLTETNGLVKVRLTLHENYSFPDTADNWDITGLNVRLFNPGSQEFCQIDLDMQYVCRMAGLVWFD